MSKLTPHEILVKLGFNIPQEGVEISPDDAFLIDKTLRLAGESINLDNIPDSEFSFLAGMAGDRVSGLRIEPARKNDAAVIQTTRKTAKMVLKCVFHKELRNGYLQQ